jgi:hypothetical protein
MPSAVCCKKKPPVNEPGAFANVVLDLFLGLFPQGLFACFPHVKRPHFASGEGRLQITPKLCVGLLCDFVHGHSTFFQQAVNEGAFGQWALALLFGFGFGGPFCFVCFAIVFHNDQSFNRAYGNGPPNV